jgi:F0F1-type ATP synthase assembly protein I
MSLTSDQSDKKPKEFAFNLALAVVVGQVGCLTLVIILAALFGGLWLDKYMDTRPIFTIILIAASVPVTLVMMFWVVKKATTKFQARSKKNETLN